MDEAGTRCPMAWAVFGPTFGYGYKVFCKHNDGVVNFFQECMPTGYMQERTTVFGEEGTMTTHHEITCEKIRFENPETKKTELRWAVFSKIKLFATIKENSPILTGDVDMYIQSIERTIPFENGIKNFCQFFYPIKDSGKYIMTTQTTINRPLGEGHHVPLPPPHFKQTEAKQWKAENEEMDHIVQDERTETIKMPD